MLYLIIEDSALLTPSGVGSGTHFFRVKHKANHMVIDFDTTLISSIRDGIVMSWRDALCHKCENVYVRFGMYYCDSADSDDEIRVEVTCGDCVRGES